jgi:hypothetical protein
VQPGISADVTARLPLCPQLQTQGQKAQSDAFVTMAGVLSALLCRDIQAGAVQLSGLGSRLAAVVRSGEFGSAATERIQAQLHLACELAEQLINLATDHGMGAAAQALLGCTSLPLECGRDLMAIPDASSSGHAGLAIASLSSQARLLTDVALIPGNPAPLAPPEQLLAWLSAAASRVLALNGTSLGRGKQGGWRPRDCNSVGVHRVMMPLVMMPLLTTSTASLPRRLCAGSAAQPGPYGLSHLVPPAIQPSRGSTAA